MIEVIFLIVLALVWIIFAVIQDSKTKEIANWLNFSLIVFAMGFRFFYSLFSLEDFTFLYQGLIGLGIFFVLGNLLYYGRMFAGGDAKLMIALGAILPFYGDIISNLKFFGFFLLIFMFVGAFYGLMFSFFICFKNFKEFKKEFPKQIRKKKRLIYFLMFSGLALMILGLFEDFLFFFGIIIFAFPYFYIYSKTVEEACMIKEVKTSKLTEGDWLYKNLRVNKKLIKANWEGLNKDEIKNIRKRYKKVKIKQGIVFSPVFLISFIILVLFYFFNVMEFFLAT